MRLQARLLVILAIFLCFRHVQTICANANSTNFVNCTDCPANNTVEQACTACDSGYIINDDFPYCVQSCNVKHCLTCQDTTTCSTCQSKYTLTNNACVRTCPINKYTNPTTGNCTLCSTNSTNCINCQIAFGIINCTSCLNSFYIDSTGQCSPCTNIDPSCLTCSNSTYCLSCSGTTVVSVDGSTCLTPPTCTVNFCKFCISTSNTTCQNCLPGFTKQTDGSCLIACSSTNNLYYDPVSQGCLCNPGYYLSGSTCQQCTGVTNCATCSSNTTCTICSIGFFLSSGACTACGTNCLICTSSTACILCANGYAVNQAACIFLGTSQSVVVYNNQTVLCPIFCSSCAVINSVLSCQIVIDGYFLDNNGLAVRCSDSCKKCSYPSTTVCTGCPNGKILQSGGVCTSCADSNCLFCNVDVNVCSSCTIGFGVDPTTSTCKACGKYCLTCLNAGPGKCDTCITSYIADANGNCVTCVGCTLCDLNDPTTCKGCSDGTFQDTDGTCNSCSSSCKTCSSAILCSVCFAGYQVENSACVVPLPAPCVQSFGGKCQSCFGQYTLNNSTNLCDPDLTCNATNICITCPNSYYQIGTNCFNCPASTTCASCRSDNSSLCAQCVIGLYLTAANACANCPTGCAACNSPLNCTLASSGYYLQIEASQFTGNVYACASECATCSAGSKSQCTSCPSGYTLSGVTCRSSSYVAVTLILTANTGAYQGFEGKSLANKKTILGANFLIFFQTVLQFLGYANDPNYLRFISVSISSIALSMQASTTNGQSSSSVQSNIQSVINNNAAANGFSVVSGTTSTINSSSSSSSSTNLGLILGLVIPIPIIILIFICAIIYKKRNATNVDDSENKETNGYIQREQEDIETF